MLAIALYWVVCVCIRHRTQARAHFLSEDSPFPVHLYMRHASALFPFHSLTPCVIISLCGLLLSVFAEYFLFLYLYNSVILYLSVFLNFPCPPLLYLLSLALSHGLRLSPTDSCLPPTPPCSSSLSPSSPQHPSSPLSGGRPNRKR